MRGLSPDAQRKFEALQAGEVWAYRPRQVDPLVPVEVMRTGTNLPPRVLVRHMNDEFEGREEWVPPNRLKVLWTEADEFRAMEGRWEAVLHASQPSEAEQSAAWTVFDKLIADEIAELGYNARSGVVQIHDLDALASFLDLDPDELRSGPLSFIEDGDLVAPWAVTQRIATRACERNPDSVMRDVEDEEATAAQEATYGKWYPATRGYHEISVPPEDCARFDDEHGRPVRDLLRRWCGQEAVARRDELHALRTEARRIGKLAESAIEALRGAGAEREADRIERDLGVPIEVLRHPDG